MKKYIDLSITLQDQMPVYPSDDPFTLKTRKTLARDGYNDQTLHASMHVGTHIDAPSHMLESTIHVSDYKLSDLIGQGVLINTDSTLLKKDIKTLDLKHKMVLINTNHKPLNYENYPLLTEDVIDYFIKQKIKCLLLDTPSPDDAPFILHQKLLSNNIPIVENVINMEDLKAYQDFTIYVIPLKIEASGAYTRVFAEVKETED